MRDDEEAAADEAAALQVAAAYCTCTSSFHRFAPTSLTLPMTMSPTSPTYLPLTGTTETSLFTLSTTPAFRVRDKRRKRRHP